MMNVLSRAEIISIFKTHELKIETPDNYYETAADSVHSRSNPFQACSLDLHVGAIYIPESLNGDLGSMTHPKTDDHVLGTGGTVLISTREKITLPSDVGAICFSPSSMALKGVMITNMGHIDPGYSGNLHFTAINMGNEPYGLKVNYDCVCTVILFRLHESVEQPYGEGHLKQLQTNQGTFDVSGSVYYSLPKLARDFLSVEKRAKEVAEKIFNRTAFYSLLAAIVIAGVPIFQIFINKPWETEINKANNKIEALEKKLDYEKRIIELETKLDKIKTNTASSNP